MEDSTADPSWFPHVGWRIDGRLQPRAADHLSSTQLVYCSPQNSRHTSTHVAKLLPSQATDEQWRWFERHAYLAVMLSADEFRWLWPLAASYWNLSAPSAILVYPRLQGSRLDDWVTCQPQWVARAAWIDLGCHLLAQLEALHRLGYVHGRICPEHVWVDAQGRLHLLGLGQCAAVGQALAAMTPGGRRSSRFDAPELQRATGEATSAQDIYATAAIIDFVSGGSFAATPVGQCMQAACPYDRPTAGELLELFRSYQHELQGAYRTPQSRAA